MSVLRTDYTTDVVLGERYRDEQTGIEGIATAISFYQYGCERVNIEVVSHDAKEIKDYGFDAPRLIRVRDEVPIPPSTRTGGPQPMVSRPGAVGR